MTAVRTLTFGAIRRDKWQIGIWTLGIFVAAVVSAVSTSTTYGTLAERVSALKLVVGNPAFLISRGMPQGTDPGAFLFFQMGMVFAVMFATYGILFAVRHGRSEEEAGVTELLRASGTSHTTAVTATLLSGSIAQLILGLGMFLGFTIGGTPLVGSLWASFTLALVGVIFVAVGILCGQLVSTGRAAIAIGLSLVAITYLVRAAADAVSVVNPETYQATPNVIAWFSPLSLAEVVNPYGVVHPGALAILIASALLSALLAVRIEASRQFGASLLPQRQGKPHAHPSLKTPFRLALRLQRGTLIGMLILGFSVGAFAATLALLGSSAAENDPAIAATIRTTVGEDGPIYDLLLGYVMLFVAEAAAVAGTLAILRARKEETTGNTETVRGTPTGPLKWIIAQTTVAFISAITVVVTAWIGATIFYVAWGSTWGEATGTVLVAVTAQLPAALLYISVACLLFALAPRVAPAITWALLLVGIFFAEFGGRANLPEWLVATTPFTHTPVVTIQDSSMIPLLWMSVAAIGLTVAASLAYTRRDLTP